MIKYQKKTWRALEKKRIPTKFVILIKDMYTDVVTNIKTCDGESNVFPVKIGLHQRLALSPYIFTLVMDEDTRNIQGNISWCMFFVDDVVLIDESKIRVDKKLELWQQTLESKDSSLNGTKNEVSVQ
jgi:Reverse transcriptase (RNA-dependent DNA polymerase)